MPDYDSELSEIIYQMMGEESALFMSSPLPGRQQIMPEAQLDKIGKNTVAKLSALLRRVEVEAIKKTFPHLWHEYCSFEDERSTLEQSADFESFFRHDRVQKYLNSELEGVEGHE